MSSLSTFSRLSAIMETAEELPFDSASKIVLISDCHRGDGSWVDDFRHNQNLYYAALKYYYAGGFTYIDLGDSEELWKNRYLSDITCVYADTYRLLRRFYGEGRLHMLYGNHDIVKKSPLFNAQNLASFFDSQTGKAEPLFDHAVIHEGLVLRSTESGARILLVHGHQGDLLSDILWPLGRTLSRYFWRRLEFLGLRDPTSAAKNFEARKKVERKIIGWVAKKSQPVIAGHTHRPTCPPDGELPYFNTGSCVHPNCITCIELVGSELTLVKWDFKTRDDSVLFVDREPLSPPRSLLK